MPAISMLKPERRPWWWIFTGALVLACVIGLKPMVEHWMRWPAPWRDLIWWPGVFLWGLTSVWLFGVAPMLDAIDPARCTVGAPHGRMSTLRFIVWTPLGLTIVAMILSLLVFPLLYYIDRGVWFVGLDGWMVLFPTLLAGTALYGFLMSRGLERRLRRSAWRAAVCYECGYSLAGLRAARCPECGGEIAAMYDADGQMTGVDA
ncbi:MAG: hypothetical protein ACF8PN_01860 [Phycisphaerales bacterium]